MQPQELTPSCLAGQWSALEGMFHYHSRAPLWRPTKYQFSNCRDILPTLHVGQLPAHMLQITKISILKPIIVVKCFNANPETINFSWLHEAHFKQPSCFNGYIVTKRIWKGLTKYFHWCLIKGIKLLLHQPKRLSKVHASPRGTLMPICFCFRGLKSIDTIIGCRNMVSIFPASLVKSI